jgi:integrase
MVRCKRALKGWRTAVPERSRDPCPWVALALVCEHLSSSGDLGLAAARAAALQMDGYFRPSEVLAIRRCDVAQHSRSAPFAITVAPSHGPGVEAAAVAPPRAKSGQYDDTVLIGDKASLDAGRPWTRLLVRRLLTEAARAPDALLFAGLTLSKYEALFREAARACHLQPLSLTPHMLRHGGPSEDILNNVRSISQVQERGRWAAPASVRNYQKQGRVLRQLNKMSKHQQRLGRAALAALPRWLRL